MMNVETFPHFVFTVCEKQQADLVFLIDQSGSISANDYTTMKQFTTALVSSFKLSENLVRVGLAQFSSTFQNEFYLNQFYSDQAVTKHILDMKQIGGGTNIGLALDSIIDHFDASRGGRRSARISQNLVLITDGESQDDVEEAADRLRALGIEVFAIGIGDVHDLELLQITGTPDRLFTVQSFGSLEKIKQKVVDTICKSRPIQDPSGKLIGVTLPLRCSFSTTMFFRISGGQKENKIKSFPLLQPAALISPWDSISLEEAEHRARCLSAATLSSRPSCQTSFATFHRFMVFAASGRIPLRPTSPFK